MTHKKVNNADAGTNVKFGGNDLDKWSDFASGVDTDDYDINSDTQYRYDKFQIRNSANTFGHKHRSLATAPRTLTLPDQDVDLASVSLANTGPGRWIIYRTGTGTTGPYYAFNKRTGVIVYSGSSLDAVLDPVLVDIEAGDQAGAVTSFLSSGGHIYIDGTDVYYSCSAGFDGFTLPQYTVIEGPPNARILVPNGYTGYVFRIPSWYELNSTKYGSSTQGIWIKGMSLHEAGTAVKEWTGIEIQGWAVKGTGWASPGSHAGGVGGCGVIGTRITNPKRGLYLRQTNEAGWITSCWFEKIYMSGPKFAGVDQQMMGTTVTNENEFSDNVFRDIVIQSASVTLPATGRMPAYGFRNMGHRRCIYDNCLVWDMQPGQVSGNLDPFTRSDGTIVSFANEIRGGILANEFGLPSGNFASTHVLVTEGYYTAGASYPDYFQDAADNTMILGDYKIGAQMSKIYIPPIGGLGGTAALTIEGRKTDSNTLLEVQGADDSISVIQSWYNASRSERLSMTKSSSSILFESIKQTAAGGLRPFIFRMNDVGGGTGTFECFRILTNADLQIADTRNIVLGTGTGTKIGTATTQKLAFFNKTPIVQKPANPDTSAATTAQLEIEVNELKQLLRDYGLMA